MPNFAVQVAPNLFVRVTAEQASRLAEEQLRRGGGVAGTVGDPWRLTLTEQPGLQVEVNV